MADYQSQQQKAEEKLAHDLTKLIAQILLDWSGKYMKKSSKELVTGLSATGGQYLWRQHGASIKKHVANLAASLIHPVNGALHQDHVWHTSIAAEKAANEIWSEYK